MDWARAKSIILILLVAFNIFLLYGIYGYVQNQGIPAATIRNTEKILEARGVKLECAIPRYADNLAKLVVDSAAPDRLLPAGRLLGNGYAKGENDNTYINGSKRLIFDDSGALSYADASPADTVDVMHIKSAEKYAREFLINKGLVDSSFTLDESIVNGDGSVSLTYLEKYRGYLVYDNYAKVTVTDKGVRSLTFRRRHIVRLSADRTENIAAAYQILLANFDENDDVTITGIDVGFKEDLSQDMTNVQSSEQPPAWRVKVKGSTEPAYFSAFDGKPIK